MRPRRPGAVRDPRPAPNSISARSMSSPASGVPRRGLGSGGEAAVPPHDRRSRRRRSRRRWRRPERAGRRSGLRPAPGCRPGTSWARIVTRSGCEKPTTNDAVLALADHLERQVSGRSAHLPAADDPGRGSREIASAEAQLRQGARGGVGAGLLAAAERPAAAGGELAPPPVVARANARRLAAHGCDRRRRPRRRRGGPATARTARVARREPRGDHGGERPRRPPRGAAPAKPEIGQVRGPVRVHQDVPLGDPAVHQAGGVHRAERAASGSSEPRRRGAVSVQLGQRPAADEPRGDEAAALPLADLVARARGSGDGATRQALLLVEADQLLRRR